MDSLPLIVLKKIFQFLPRKYLEDTVPWVCSEWHEIAGIILSENLVVTAHHPGWG